MSTALVRPQDRYEDAEMLRTLKETVCKQATDSQFKMFIEICRGTGLNPFLKEIWFVPSVGVMAGRDGYLRVANEHPQFDGMETRVERDNKGVPIKATCSVWRKDRSHPVTCEAYFSEYRKSSGVWNQYPSAMISKVAEVLALKRSFSINGVVTEEEIGHQEPQERGSKEAAQEVAQRKLQAVKHQALSSLEITTSDAEVILDAQTEEPPSEMESKLAESVKQADPDKFKALKAFTDLKKKIIDETGDDMLYYASLGRLGFEKSNQIPKDQAREVYKAVAKAFTNWKAAQPPEPGSPSEQVFSS